MFYFTTQLNKFDYAVYKTIKTQISKFTKLNIINVVESYCFIKKWWSRTSYIFNATLKAIKTQKFTQTGFSAANFKIIGLYLVCWNRNDPNQPSKKLLDELFSHLK